MGTQVPSPKRGQSPPPILAHVYCGQTAGWIKIPLNMEVGLGPGHIVLDGNPASPKLGIQPVKIFGACLYPNHIVLDGDPAAPPLK